MEVLLYREVAVIAAFFPNISNAQTAARFALPMMNAAQLKSVTLFIPILRMC